MAVGDGDAGTLFEQLLPEPLLCCCLARDASSSLQQLRLLLGQRHVTQIGKELGSLGLLRPLGAKNKGVPTSHICWGEQWAI
jgi:hypothetical protein